MIRIHPLYNAWVTWNDKTGEYKAETMGKSKAWRCEPGETEEGVLTQSEREELEWHWKEYQKAPIKYFLPHGRARSDEPQEIANGKIIIPASTYPKEFANDGLAFINDYEHDVCMMLGPNQCGKMQPHDAVVMTPSGERRMGDLSVGDYVIGGDGKQCQITRISDNGVQPTYRVWFDSGETSVECGGSHLWVYLRHSRAYRSSSLKRGKPRTESNYNKWEVVTTDEMIEAQGDGAPSRRGFVPVCLPVEFPKVEHKFSPYVLGALIGDGCFRAATVTVTTCHPHIVDRVASDVSGMACVKWDGKTVRITLIKRSNPGWIRTEFERLGLMGKYSSEKRIPKEYLIDSAENRIELLRGLMDTDGTIGKKSAMEYYSTSKGLADDVAWLVRSLGGKAKISGKDAHYVKNGVRVDCKYCYRVRVKMQDINPFSLPCKAEKWRPIERRKDRSVYKIEETGEAKPCKCIEVNNASGTYLTDDFVVTHNSYQMSAWTAFRVLHCDESWHTFQHHGVICPEWMGPRNWSISSYSWGNVSTVWDRLQHLFPKSELGAYAEKHIPLLGGGAKILRCVDSGSTIRFNCMTQAQHHFEGWNCDGAAVDEQSDRSRMIGIIRGMTTGVGKKQIGMALTGHVLADRPDTGAAGWIKRDIYDTHMNGEENSLGLSAHVYRLSIDSTPDAIIQPSEKKRLYKTWADPSVNRSDDQENEGLARYWGGWEPGSGYMLSEWRREVHVIPPLWDDDTIPLDADLFRALDHGESAPTACIWAALIPPNNKWVEYSFACIYRLYYERNVRPAVSVPEIIRMSGNERACIDNVVDEEAGATYKVYQEIEQRERYNFSIMDSRSAAYKKDGVPLGALYQRYGLSMGSAPGGRIASTATNKGQLEYLRDWLVIDKTRKHVVTGEMGAPRLYFFDLPCIRPAIDEIEGWAKSENDPNKPKTGCDNHSISCLMYWASSQPQPGDMLTVERSTIQETDNEGDRFGLTGAILRG